MIPFLILAYILLDTEHDYQKDTLVDQEEVWWQEQVSLDDTENPGSA